MEEQMQKGIGVILVDEGCSRGRWSRFETGSGQDHGCFQLVFSSLFPSCLGERRRLFVLGLITYTPMPGVEPLRT